MSRRPILIALVLALPPALAMSIVRTAGAAGQPTLTAECQPGPCVESGAWQTTAVTVTWHADPTPTAVSGCDSQTYGDVRTTAFCQVWWGPNGTAPEQSISFPLNVETSAPVVTATPVRPPDAGGWYNHPVDVSFQGSAFSGIAGCTPAQAYAGPDTTGTTLTGSCVDNAGMTASASFSFAYDATAPTLTVSGSAGDRSVVIHWQAGASPAPLLLVQVARAPGLGHAQASVIQQGNSGALRDARVRNGVRYRYTVTATDQAGTATSRSVVATPGARLLSPAPGARVHAPPQLIWTAVPRATYYNVQLYASGKVLSIWPRRATVQLHRSWRFAGHRHRLVPGRYRWYVWPGFGSRAKARYGPLVGSATFIVR